ncbi:hypothetical protein [Mixta gaviniae]|nr:hypothetical protein [Mixta gaviniae]
MLVARPLVNDAMINDVNANRLNDHTMLIQKTLNPRFNNFVIHSD